MHLGSQAEWITGELLVIPSSIRISRYSISAFYEFSSTYCDKCPLISADVKIA